jgi:hypothetical protein
VSWPQQGRKIATVSMAVLMMTVPPLTMTTMKKHSSGSGYL